MRRMVGITFAVIVLLISGIAFAQSTTAEDPLPKNTHQFAPTVDHSGMVVTYGSEYLGTARLAYSFWFDDAVAPLEYRNPNNTEQTITLIQHQAAGTVNFAFGITDYVNIGYAFPYIVTRSFDEDWNPDDIYETETSAVEDNRLDIKILGLQRTRHCMGLGLITTTTIPFYKEDNFASDKGATVAPRLLFDIGRSWFIFATNLGYKYYSQTPDTNRELILDELKVGDELLINMAARFRFSYGQELLVDSAVKTLVEEPFGNGAADYAELFLAYRKYWYRLNYNALTLGGSFGLTRGVGTPFVRFYIGFGRDENRIHYMLED